MNEDKKRIKKKVGIKEAREYDIAHRGLVGVHKTMRTDPSNAFFNEAASPLLPFDYAHRAIHVTGEGSLYVAPGQLEFIRSCQNPEVTLPNNQDGLPPLPPGFVWNVYVQQNFKDAGRLIRLVLRATYNSGKALAQMHFMLLRRLPTDNQFTQEDILLHLPVVNLLPVITGPGFGDWGIWYDQKTDQAYNYPFPNTKGDVGFGQQDLSEMKHLYILCEEWRSAPFNATDEMRVHMIVEDRGR